MAASMIGNMPEKTGRSLAEWLKIAAKSKPGKHREILNHLKSEHGLTHGYASLVATKALEGDKPPASDDDLVAAQYSGGKDVDGELAGWLRQAYEAS